MTPIIIRAHYTPEAFRHDTAHDVVSYLRDRQPNRSSVLLDVYGSLPKALRKQHHQKRRRTQLPPRSLMEQCGGLFDNEPQEVSTASA